jgi:hypothetical protein
VEGEKGVRADADDDREDDPFHGPRLAGIAHGDELKVEK